MIYCFLPLPHFLLVLPFLLRSVPVLSASDPSLRRQFPDLLITNPTFGPQSKFRRDQDGSRTTRREILLRTLQLIRQRPAEEFQRQTVPRARSVPKKEDKGMMNRRVEQQKMVGEEAEARQWQRHISKRPKLLGAETRLAPQGMVQQKGDGQRSGPNWEQSAGMSRSYHRGGGGGGAEYGEGQLRSPPSLHPQQKFTSPRLRFYFTPSITAVNQDFTILPGSPGLACLYGLPIPQYSTPRKRCLPHHPMCGLQFTCVMDVHAVDENGREVEQWWTQQQEEEEEEEEEEKGTIGRRMGGGGAVPGAEGSRSAVVAGSVPGPVDALTSRFFRAFGSRW